MLELLACLARLSLNVLARGHRELNYNNNVNMLAPSAVSEEPKPIALFTDLMSCSRRQAYIPQNHGTQCNAPQQVELGGDCLARKSKEADLTRRRNTMLAYLHKGVVPHSGFPQGRVVSINRTERRKYTDYTAALAL
ncbi:unspecified product [Leishmania tarentolae]|uniref:Unspecified product n=1 Tax=Leishmania tarentolae TaxID=5689 RepID=A0A640KFJ6_LEITA|nr:unspecified product [Leishmania tarentolae]